MKLRLEQGRPSSRRLAEFAVGPQLASPVYILVNALWGGILSFTLSNDILADNVAAHLMAVISAQALFSAVIAWCYRWNEKSKRLSPRQFILVFVLAGALRGALLQFLISALELTAQPNYFYRVYSGITSVGFSAWFWALLFGIIMEWRRQSGRLASERSYLAQLQTEVDSQVSSATQLEIEAFRTYLMTNLRVNEKSDIAKVREELLAVISGVIRPVVEQMLAKRTAVEFESSDDKPERVQLDNVVQYVSVSQSIQPPVQVLPATPSALAAAAFIFGYPGGIAAMASFVVIWPVTLYLLKFTVAPLIDRLSTGWRVAGVIGVSALGALPTTVLVASIKGSGSSASVAIEFVVYAVVGGIVLVIWFAYLEELRRVYLMREQYLKHIHWKVAEVNSRRWHQQLYFARRVHGALQSEVAAVAIRIEQELASGVSGIASVEQIRTSLQERVEGVFAEQQTVANPMDVLSEISETWDGICRVSISLGHDDSIKIMHDPIAVDTALEIIREGISNAIRHGNAEDVWVSLSLADDNLVRVEVINDGSPISASEREGMGTKYLQECAVTYSITEERSRTRLVADVPFRG